MNNPENVEQQMREFFGRVASEADAYHAALLDVPDAVKQLSRSGRGLMALRGFTRFCENEGAKLTGADWKALSTLCLASGYTPPNRQCFNPNLQEA